MFTAPYATIVPNDPTDLTTPVATVVEIVPIVSPISVVDFGSFATREHATHATREHDTTHTTHATKPIKSAKSAKSANLGEDAFHPRNKNRKKWNAFWSMLTADLVECIFDQLEEDLLTAAALLGAPHLAGESAEAI